MPDKKGQKAPVGRPTKMTEATIGKLEEAFAIGASDREACFYADINMDTLYAYQKKNPKFSERKASLKERPVLLARQSVVKGMVEDPHLALKYLERRKKSEFGLRTELTGADGAALPTPIFGGYSVQENPDGDISDDGKNE